MRRGGCLLRAIERHRQEVAPRTIVQDGVVLLEEGGSLRRVRGARGTETGRRAVVKLKR